MKRKLTALLAVSALLASSAVSCGNDEPAESSVPDFPELSAAEAEDNTESETEAETESEKEEAAETTAAETKAAPEITTKAAKAEKAENSNEDTSDKSGDDVQQDSESDVQPDEPVDNPDSEPVQEPAPEPQSVVFSADMLNGDAGAVVSALGGNPDIETAPACFANGADSKTYIYDGLVLQCYVLDGSEYIYAFTITGGSYTAENGITVGSSRGDVESYYGAGEDAGNDVRYIYDSYDMTITYDGDTVTVIDFYAPV